jgi:hypothetical protein
VKKTKKKIFLFSLTTLLFVLSLAAPVLALPPATGTFTKVTVQVGVDPGKQFMTGDILHIKGSISTVYHYGGPWGNSITSQSVAQTVQIDTVTGTGSVLLHAIDVYSAGTVEGTVNTKIVGRGPYLYLGPTFTYTLAGRTETITHGAVYIGGLIEGFAVKRGVSGDLTGVQIKSTFTGVNIMVGPLTGVHLVEGTGTYLLPG